MRFNQILIIDSIPADELNTARRLYDDVSARAVLFDDSPAVGFFRIESGRDFLDLLGHLARAVRELGNYPILHVECHGGERGLTFADGSFVDWLQMKPRLIDLNIAMQLNLLVVVAACVGSAITYTVTNVDRAPLWGLIGPVRNVRPNELEGPLLAFYETLLRTHSARAALDALHRALPGSYVFRSSEAIFQFVWDKYQAEAETPEQRLRRAADLHARMPDFPNKPSVAQIADLFRVKNPEFFRTFRQRFFMCDLFPEHDERFTVRYETLAGDDQG
jgi:hypothetical protein